MSWYRLCIGIIVLVLLLPIAVAVSTVTRTIIQDSIPAGGATQIGLIVKEDPAAPESSLFITETLPPGWIATDISNRGAFNNGNIRWGRVEDLGSPVEDMMFTYNAHAPANAPLQSRHQISGLYIFSEHPQQNVGGETTITIGAAPPPVPVLGGGQCNPQTHEPCSAETFCSPKDFVCIPRFADGASCSNNRMCQSNRCVAAVCAPVQAVPPPPPPPIPPPEPAPEPGADVQGVCQADADCAANSRCINGACNVVVFAGTVSRSFVPAQAQPTTGVAVHLHIDDDEQNPAESIFIIEQVPAGWIIDVDTVSHNGGVVGNEIRWGRVENLDVPIEDMDLTYTVTVPENTPIGSVNPFQGRYIFNSIEELDIGGAASVEIVAEQPLACGNDDSLCAGNQVCEEAQGCLEDANRVLNEACKIDANCGPDLVCVNNQCAQAGAASLLPAPILIPDPLRQFLLGIIPSPSFTPVENCPAGGNCHALSYQCTAPEHFVAEQSQQCANGCVDGQCQAAPPALPVLLPQPLKDFLLTARIDSFAPAQNCEGDTCRRVNFACADNGFVRPDASVCTDCQAAVCLANGEQPPVDRAGACVDDASCPGEELCANGYCAAPEDPEISECKSIAINIASARAQSQPMVALVRQFIGTCLPADLDQACRATAEGLRNLADAELRVALADPANAACFNRVFDPSYCFDSDRADDPVVKGRVIYFDSTTNALNRQFDTCGATGLVQFQCVSNVAAAVQPFQCPTVCQNGACSTAGAGTPVGGDAGVAGGLPADQQCLQQGLGSVMYQDVDGNTQSLVPRCSDQTPNILLTFTCDATRPEGYRSEPVTCDRGCDVAARACSGAAAFAADAAGGEGGGGGDGGGGGNGGSGGGRSGGGGRARRLNRNIICGDGLCQSAFGENQFNCPQDCGQPAATPTPRVDTSGVATAPSGAPSMPLEQEQYIPPVLPPAEEPASPYPQRPDEQFFVEPPEKKSNLWLYIAIIIGALAVLGGGGAVTYNYWENKKLEEIPDYKKQKIIDYIKYYGSRGYSQEQLKRHLAAYGVPGAFIEKVYKEMRTASPSSHAAAGSLGASSAGTSENWLVKQWDRIKSVFEKKEQPPREGLKQF